ncbi:hypothetical protein SAMN05216559_0192 [Halomicrobium zhouii]|uniref:DUF5602 domain-containing protein n=1 Tax=Halomicrobium zhouii TaxID=767519 RepID=A0A1I6K4Q2_9EURY|nr:hypothetical protein [Halomicrobium zhouii]SFR86221.1 hypothetical protein SAMN05216559_0192 [Halomicrobium zhouii]
MVRESTATDGERIEHRTNWRVGRRRFVRTAFATAPLGTVGLASASGSERDAAAGDDCGAFPPRSRTEWGPSVNLGGGEARTFTTETASGTRVLGVLIDRAALDDLPSAAALADCDRYDDKYGPDGLATTIHGKRSLEFFVPFPDVEETSIRFLGLNWNPGGHPPPDVYGVPHFDVHFHALPMATVDAIEGLRRATHDVPTTRIPEGFSRAPDPKVGGPAVVTDMGEHLVNPDAPEFHGDPFANTLIWGVHDADGDGVAELSFVEPMVTRAYLTGLSATHERPVPQPEDAHGTGPWPRTYGVRDVPGRDAVAITVRGFDGGC